MYTDIESSLLRTVDKIEEVTVELRFIVDKSYIEVELRHQQSDTLSSDLLLSHA